MKGKAKPKVLTSGRLSGATKGSRGTAGNAAAAAAAAAKALCEPAYSLYSTDTEDQVTTLHKGLDRCAALLNDMLHADTEAPPSPPRVVKSAAVKSRFPSFQVKKSVKKVPGKTGQRTPSTTPRRACGIAITTPAAHTGVTLHPPRSTPPRPAHTATPPSQPSVLLSVHQSSYDHRSPKEGDLVPVRDVQSSPTLQVEEDRTQTVQCLLKELKALIAGQGSVAERLLSRLELTVSSPQASVHGPIVQVDGTPSLLSENAQLRKRVRTLNQQLKEREKAERHQSLETFSSSQVANLQQELDAAQSRLQELQDDLTELRQALQDTRSQLRDQEAENALLKKGLEATRRRLLASEQEKSELASVAQQRLEEIATLNRLLRSQSSSALPAVTDVAHDTRGCMQEAAAPPTDRIAIFLTSLSQAEANAAEDEPPLAESQTHRSSGAARSAEAEPERPAGAAPSQCDGASVWSEWSVRSGSTFDTRDEAAFRDGLAALDASIASLQRTIQLELRS